MKKPHQLESLYSSKKEFYHLGEITSRDRPKNSLLDVALDFKQKAPTKLTKQEEDSIFKKITERIKSQTYDNLVLEDKEVEEEELLEMSTDNEEERNESEEIENIEDLIEQIKAEVMKLTDFNYEIREPIIKFKEEKKEPKKSKKKVSEKTKLRKELSKNKNVEVL